jgi:hypothetical protein
VARMAVMSGVRTRLSVVFVAMLISIEHRAIH